MKSLILALLLVTCTVDASELPQLHETPALEQQVQAGQIESIAQRLPDTPYVDTLAEKQAEIDLGRQGGSIRLLMGKAKDVRMLVVYGYARLIGFNDQMELEADILESFDVVDNRQFTFHLRPGHRWSDGAPFTSDDFRYFWEDVAMNDELSPFGPPPAMVVDGQPPTFEVLDKYTVRYTWQSPNPEFLLALAGPSPLYIYQPAHYLKQFHARYADPDRLAQLIAEADIKKKKWTGLHQRQDHQYKFDNPDMPTLQPWVPTTPLPSEHFVFKRNPYYHRIDSTGHQLPYLDEVVINISSSKLIPAKTGAGESDLQGRYLEMSNYTFLREGAERSKLDVRLWSSSRGSRVAIYPNLNANDDTWRPLMRDVRFRRALSLAINRHEINEVIYFGLALEGANTLIPASPLYKPEYRNAWSRFDLKTANQLLDELGLHKRDARGIRLLPDGRPAEIIIQSAGESTEETDVLELIHDSWMEAGIKLHVKPTEREIFRNRVFAGDALMSVWFGLENGLATADMTPAELAPTSQQQLQWPKWGKHYETGQDEPPQLPEAQHLLELYQQWRHASATEERRRIWGEMLQIHADQVYSIGTVTEVKQPIVVNAQLHNVPKTALWNWEPNAFFGRFRPDRFWREADGSNAIAGGQ
ncbi:peptide ABC transporter substrate-binding protein [Marinobacterium zhoushanense]|uniref:Peptide ABC transporter substrate-binding protein n=1 Tax=Marinobacterium zhoushanense TaxID=1679163 RepID=A0ABQ1KDT0_9GAMM|nr:ABC transporter substrate-binding protein [Marinobacterium zhoushanense]GGB95029.1 peptide ABC transporter substrate-binding protein [Marinobacterium zhoushanense]